MRRSHIILALALASDSWLGGCSWSQKVESKVAPDTLSIADRCGLIMQAAMPFAQIDIGDRGSRSPDVRTLVTTVAGTRTDIPESVAGGRDLAVECTFTDNVLTAFRWTKGGPPSAADAGAGLPPPANMPPPANAGPHPSASASQKPPAGNAKPFH